MAFKLISQADYSRLTGIPFNRIRQRVHGLYYVNCTRRHRGKTMLYRDRALYVDGLGERPDCSVWLRRPPGQPTEPERDRDILEGFDSLPDEMLSMDDIDALLATF